MKKTINALLLCLSVVAVTACSSSTARGESAGTTDLDANTVTNECADKDSSKCADKVPSKCADKVPSRCATDTKAKAEVKTACCSDAGAQDSSDS